jgi:predicted Zn-ribbon and HTH transcriptional regulator
VEFLLDRKEKHTAKANGERKPTKTQVENEGIKEQILDALRNSDLPMNVADIMESVGLDSNQKTTALLTQLKNAEVVVRTEVKGKAYYALPTEVK